MLADKLRVMLCLELFLNSKFYSSHPFIQNFYDKNKDEYSSLTSVLSYAVSHSTSDTIKLELGNDDFVKHEAVLLCQDKVWCSRFLVFFLFIRC